jgi:acyl carrier protein
MVPVSSRVRSIISEQLGIGEDEITSDSSFMEDLGADSLDIVEVVMAVEEEFGLDIPDSSVENMENVKSLIDYIEKVYTN